MKSRIAREPDSPVSPDEVRQALGTILASRHFVNAHQKKKFLKLICDFYLEGRAHELNEHILGYDVFGRDSSYNPAQDPIVRVFAHEIRKKLEDYYTKEGAADPIRMEIPAGRYQPVFARQLPDSSIRSSESTDEQEAGFKPSQLRSRFRLGGLALAFALLGLAIAVISLAITNRQLRQQLAAVDAAKDSSTYGTLWASFLNDSNPPLVILSNTPALRVANPSDPEARQKDSIPLGPESIEALKDKFVMNPEVSIKESGAAFGDNAEPSNARSVIERNQNPRLIVSTNVYTGVGEAIGLHYLTDFFRKANRNISLKQSRTLSAEDLKNRNVIMLGGVWVNEWSSKLSRSEDFVFTNKGTIENRNLQPGEEPLYVPQFDRRTGNLLVDYALITVKPNISAVNNDVMLLAGIYSQGTEATVEYVTNKNYLDQLNQHLQEPGAPRRYFQALLKVGVENGIPTTISLLALHELQIAKP